MQTVMLNSERKELVKELIRDENRLRLKTKGKVTHFNIGSLMSVYKKISKQLDHVRSLKVTLQKVKSSY